LFLFDGGLLIGDRGGACFFRFGFGCRSVGRGFLCFLLEAFCVGLRGFGLGTSLVGFLAALHFGFSVGASLGFAFLRRAFFGGNLGLRFFF